MLRKFKTQSTDDTTAGDDGRPPGQGIVSPTPTDAEGTQAEDASRNASTPAAQPQLSIELDEVFGLLKNRRRRDVLRHLDGTDEPMRIGELAEEIAARECEKPIGQINSQDRKRVYVGLYQCHLPKLADVGVIEYNKPRGTIDRGPTFDTITHYLPATETPPERETPYGQLKESLTNLISSGRRFL